MVDPANAVARPVESRTGLGHASGSNEAGSPPSSLTYTELEPGLSVWTGSPSESRFTYKEIFRDECYRLDSLPERPLVIDAGANIGLYTLWLKKHARPDARVWAFEPAALTFSALDRNWEEHKRSSSSPDDDHLHGSSSSDGVTLFRCGLGRQDEQRQLTYYPQMPSSSTLWPAEKDRLREVCRDEWGVTPIDPLFDGSELQEVRIRRLSDLIREQEKGGNKIASIDMLKLDVEGAEVDVLRGLDDEHWPLLRNVYMEIYDVDGRLEEALEFLRTKRFVAEVEVADWSPKATKFYMVKAKRGQ